MEYKGCNKLWESEFDNIVSKIVNIQDLNLNQLKLEVHDIYEKDEETKTKLEPTDDIEVIKSSSRQKTIKTRCSIVIIRKRFQRI